MTNCIRTPKHSVVRQVGAGGFVPRQPQDDKKARDRSRALSSLEAAADYSFAVTFTPSTCGIVFGAPMAAPMIIGKGTGLAGSALILMFFGASR